MYNNDDKYFWNEEKDVEVNKLQKQQLCDYFLSQKCDLEGLMRQASQIVFLYCYGEYCELTIYHIKIKQTL